MHVLVFPCVCYVYVCTFGEGFSCSQSSFMYLVSTITLLQNSVSLLQREEFPSSGSLTVTIYVFGLLQRKRPR